jgi:hypothetical protein
MLRLAIANIGYQGCGKYPESDSCRYDLHEIGHYYHEYGTRAKCNIGSVQCINRPQRERGDNRSEKREGAAEKRGEELRVHLRGDTQTGQPKQGANPRHFQPTDGLRGA